MLNIGRTTLTLLATLALTIGAACASSPDIPEESSEKKNRYRSAESEESPDSGDSREKSGSKKRGKQAGKGQSGAPMQTGQGSSKPPKATGPVAHVDGDPIPAEAFNEEIAKISKTGKFPPALLHRFKGRLIERLIDQRLIDNAIDNSSVEVTEKEVDAKLDKVRKEFDAAKQQQGGSTKGAQPQSLEQLAGQYGISSDELRDSIRRSIAIEKLLLDQGVELPTDKEVKKFYEDNPDKFSKPEQVHVRHILLKVKPGAGDEKWKSAKEKIDKIHKQASKEETDFAKLAKKKSDGPSAKNGGDIGFIGKKQFDENFTKVAFELEKGEVSEPVKTRYGWHVIQLVERRASEKVPFEKIKPKLAEQLKNQRIHEQLKSYIKKLREDAEIEKHPDNVE